MGVANLVSERKSLMKIDRLDFSTKTWHWFAYIVPTVILFYIIPLDGIKDFDPRDLALAILGGQIGFLGFLFAIVTFVADTGVLTGTRGVNYLTKSIVPYFAFVLASTTMSAICTVHPSVALSKFVVMTAIVIAMGLPLVVLHLARRASAEEVAKTAEQFISRLLRRSPELGIGSEKIERRLNDLRASSIMLWRRGDLEGCKSLLEAFLRSIPEKGENRPDVRDLSHLTFLSMWIEILGEEDAGLLFLAHQLSDEIVIRLQQEDLVLAVALMDRVGGTVRQCLGNDGHQEFKIHSLRILQNLLMLISESTVIKKNASRNTLQTFPIIEMVNTYSQLGLDVIELNKRGKYQSKEEIEIAVDVCLISALTNSILSDHLKSGFPLKIAATLQFSIETKFLPSIESIEKIVRYVYEVESEITESSDPRVFLFGPMCGLVSALVEGGEFEEGSNIFNKISAKLTSTKMDSGSSRYIEKCLEQLGSRIELDDHIQNDLSLRQHMEFRGQVFNQLSYYVARSGKNRDIKENLDRLLKYLSKNPKELRTVEQGIEVLIDSVFISTAWQDTWIVVEMVLNGRRSDWKSREQFRQILFRTLKRADENSRDTKNDFLHVIFGCLRILIQCETEDRNIPSTRSIGRYSRSLEEPARAFFARRPPKRWTDRIVNLHLECCRRLLGNGSYEQAIEMFSSTMSVLNMQVELLLSDFENYEQNYAAVARSRKRIFSEFAQLVRSMNQLQKSRDYETFDLFLQILSDFGSVWTMDQKVAESYFDAALEIGIYCSRLPNLRRKTSASLRLATLIGEYQKSESDAGFNLVAAGALRGISSLSPDKTQFESTSQLLATLHNELTSTGVSTEDKLALITAYRFAVMGEREQGDTIDSARLQLKLCRDLLSSEDAVDSQISNSVLNMIVAACQDIQSIENLMKSERDKTWIKKLTELSDNLYSIVEYCIAVKSDAAINQRVPVILCQSFNEIELACRKIQSQCSRVQRSEFSKSSPEIKRWTDKASSVAFETQRLIWSLTTKNHRDLPESISIIVSLYKFGYEFESFIESEVGGSIAQSDDVEFSGLRNEEKYSKPQLNRQIMKFLESPKEVRHLQDWEWSYVVSAFDELAERVNALSSRYPNLELVDILKSEYVTHLGNSLAVRIAIDWVGGYTVVTQKFMGAVLELLSQKIELREWLVSFLFGDDDCKDSILYKTLLLNQTQEIEIDAEVFLDSVSEIVTTYMQIEADRRNTSRIRRNIAEVRKTLANTSIVSASLEKILRLWNPFIGTSLENAWSNAQPVRLAELNWTLLGDS
jgi:hypothetical protein